MKKIILDCDLMKFRDSGLYHYCLNLGLYVKEILDKEQEEKISFYIPSDVEKAFGSQAKCIIEKRWHKKFLKPFLWDCNLWHIPFQSGRIVPHNNKGIKILLTIHDLNCLHEDVSEKQREKSLQRTQGLIDSSDAIVCISNHCKQDVINNLNITNKPVYVIHNGTHFINEPPAMPKRYKPSRHFIFTMGYVNRKKNFHTLVPLLRNPDLELVVAGRLDEPDYVNKMIKLAEWLQVEDRLHILGPISEEDKAWYFKNCMAFMLPSLAEGFGAPVVEAMSFGKPVFLSDKTSLPEIGGDEAFYFSSFDPPHMQQVFNYGMLQYQKNGLAKQIMKRGHSFKWKEKAIEYVKVYRSLL